MWFNNYVSNYHQFKRKWMQEHGKENMPPVKEFHTFSLAKTFQYFEHTQAQRFVTNHNHLQAEWAWWRKGRPYYNFHPKLIPTFARSKLTFPASYITLPYDAMAVQFADDPSLRIDENHSVKAALAYKVGSVFSTNDLIRGKQEDNVKFQNRFSVWLDIGEVRQDEIIYTYRQLAWDDETTSVEEALGNLPVDEQSMSYGVRIREDTMQLVIKLVVSIAFLSSDHSPIIIPHVLKSDEMEFQKGDEETRKRLAEKARKTRDQVGFLVGSHEMFDVGFVGSASPAKPSEVSEREIKFANIVTGHWQMYRYGPKRQLGKVRWVMPYVRSKDKPFRHEE